MNDTVIIPPKGLPFGGNPGRPKGARSGTTLARLEAARVARENPGELPLDYLLKIMRDPEIQKDDPERCDRAAMAALTCLHPRLQAIKVDNVSTPTVSMTPDELRGQILKLLLDSGAIRADLLKPVNQGILPGRVLDNDDERDGE
jgi:hypothetical protein